MKAKEFDELIESVREGGRILRGEANPSREFTFIPEDVQAIRKMGKVLQQALTELTKLSETEQDVVGAWILAELKSERRWNDLFARSPDLLAEMADDAIREDEAGLTEPLGPEKLL
jgi:hypothetical protein